jgi:hypothetical protein
MGAPEVTRFLSALAVQGKVAAATQNQALSALLFLYRHVLHQDPPWLEDVVQARRPKRLPVVLTRDDAAASAVLPSSGESEVEQTNVGFGGLWSRGPGRGQTNHG